MNCWPATRPSRPSGPRTCSGDSPGPLDRWQAQRVGKLPVDHGNISLDFKLKQFLRGASEPSALAHQRWLGSFSGSEIERVLVDNQGFDVEAEHLARAASLATGGDPLTQSLRLYQDTYLPDDILAKVDRASMACGLEVRAPFLDARAGRFDPAPAFFL